MKILFQFPNKNIELKVILLDNPAVASWAEHFLYRNINVTAFKQYHVNPKIWNDEEIKNIVSVIRDRIEKLAQVGYICEETVPDDIRTLDQNWANRIHRFFTHTQKSFNEDPRGMNMEVVSWLQDVNEYVHQFENYLDTPFKDFDIMSAPELNLSADPKFTADDWWVMRPEWRQYHTREHHDIILGPQILGKTILKSYFDQDDPTDWDTSGYYCNNTALQILTTNFREQIYSSDNFRYWVESHGATLDTVWYDFPIGDVEDRDILDEIIDRLPETPTVTAVYLP